MVGTSRAILDIAQQKQDGYSMRVMEAIFFNKKLVTTNTAVKQSVFYDENNIFIVDLKQLLQMNFKLSLQSLLETTVTKFENIIP